MQQKVLLTNSNALFPDVVGNGKEDVHDQYCWNGEEFQGHEQKYRDADQNEAEFISIPSEVLEFERDQGELHDQCVGHYGA